MKPEADALVDGRQAPDQCAQLRLADENDRQEIFARAIEIREQLQFVKRLRGHFLRLVEDQNEVASLGVNAIDDLAETLIARVLGLRRLERGAFQILEHAREQVAEIEGRILLGNDAELARAEPFREHRARDGFARADLAREHPEQHGLLLDEESQAIQSFVVVAALEKKARVPGGLEWTFAQVPVTQQIHARKVDSVRMDCTHNFGPYLLRAASVETRNSRSTRLTSTAGRDPVTGP